MDELKKKIEALTPQNAFYAVAGMLALMLLLFLVGDVIEATNDGETLSFSGWACMTGMKYEILVSQPRLQLVPVQFSHGFL